MRDLVVTENITLDGVIDALAGWFSVADDAEVISPTLWRRSVSRARRPMPSFSRG